MAGEVFSTEVSLRWSDQDLNRHVNHARIVTLLEEARIPWIFAAECPTPVLQSGAVITSLELAYRGQVVYPGPVTVRMWITELRAAYFVSKCELRNAGTAPDSPAQVVSTCTIAAFDVETQRPRRLPKAEHDFLRQYLVEPAEKPTPASENVFPGTTSAPLQ